ncbi:hypothetical protein ACIRG5_47250 [Lentzea sp. NPDC102401]|uniref:hypothetical protein n=1 Tax=Lentzea sp. NPDC102401 TaxID=3364128 RepID=UPI0037FFCA52
MSPWLASPIGVTCGLAVRIGVLALLLKAGTPLSVARPASEAAGGAVIGALTEYLINGRFGRHAAAAGLFEAISAASGRALSRAAIERMRNLPT